MEGHEPQGDGRAYDAFISYSHHADERFAPQLERALQRLAKPWLRRQALHVFRDETGFAYEPELQPAIDRVLDRSRCFVLLASPEAARSAWVDHELRHWLARNSIERLILVVTAGTWEWDEARGDFDREASTAVPEALRGRWRTPPRHVDMSWTKGRQDLTLRNGRFRDKVAEVAAPIHGKEKRDLVGEDLRLQRRNRRILVTGVTALAVLTVAALAAAALAVRAQQEAGREQDRAEAQTVLAETAARRATSQALAARSLASIGNRVDERALLAAQAWAVEPTDEARAALVAALTATRHTRRYVHDQLFEVAALALSPDGSRLAVADARGVVTLTDLGGGEVVETGLEPEIVRDLLFLDDETLAVLGPDAVTVLGLADGEVDRVDGLDGQQVVALDRRGYAVVSGGEANRHRAISGSLPLSPAVGAGEVIDLQTGEATTFRAPNGSGSVVRAEGGQVLLVGTTTGDPGEDDRLPVSLRAYDPVLDEVVVLDVVVDLPVIDPLTSPTLFDDRPLAVAIDLEEGLVAVAGETEVQLVTLPGRTARAVTVPAEVGRITRVALADGALVVGALDGSTFVHDVASGTTVDVGGILGIVRAVSSASGGGLVAVGGQDDTVQVVDVSGGSMGTSLPVVLAGCEGDCLALSDTGRAAVVASGGAVTGGIDGSGWEEATPGAVSVALDPAGTLLAAGTEGGTVELTDLAGDAEARVFTVSTTPGPVADDRVRSVAIGPDGARLAADAAVVDLATGEVTDVDAYPDLLDLQFGADGRLLLGSSDETSPVDLDGDRVTEPGELGPEHRDPELRGAVRSDVVALRDLAASPAAVATCDVPFGSEGASLDLRDCGVPSPRGLRATEGDGSTEAVWSSAMEVPGFPYNAATFDRRGGVLLVSDVGVLVHAPLEELRSGAQAIGEPDERIVLGSEDVLSARSLAGGLVVVVETATGVRLFDRQVGTDLGAAALGGPGTPGFGFAAAPDGESLVVGQVGRAPVVVALDPRVHIDRLCAMASRDLAVSVRDELGLVDDVPRGCPGQPVATEAGLASGATSHAATIDDPPTGPAVAPATIEAFLQARFAPEPGVYAGPCASATDGVSSRTLLCSDVLRQDETEAVVVIGIVGSEAIEYLRLTFDGSGWVEAEAYVASGDLPDPGLPDWAETPN